MKEKERNGDLKKKQQEKKNKTLKDNKEKPIFRHKAFVKDERRIQKSLNTHQRKSAYFQEICLQ